RVPSAMNFVMTLGVVLAVFWFDAAVAQEGYFGHDPDKWYHGFYQTLERPDTKSPCCNLTDCRPTSGRQGDGHYEVKVNGAWVSVPPGKILKQLAPDLGFHVCAPFKFDGQPDLSRRHRAQAQLGRRGAQRLTAGCDRRERARLSGDSRHLRLPTVQGSAGSQNDRDASYSLPPADFGNPATTQAINIGLPIDTVRISQTILEPAPSASASKDL